MRGLILSALTIVATILYADSGLSPCLEDEVRGKEFLSYQLNFTDNSHRPPLSESFSVYEDNALLNDPNQITQILRSLFTRTRHFIYFPVGEKIRVGRDEYGNLEWHFPEGTVLRHELVVIEGDREKLIDVRIERRFEKTWVFGIYESDPTSSCQGFRLRTGAAKERRELKLIHQQKNYRINYKPLSPQSCVDCHHIHHTDDEESGPCGFNEAHFMKGIGMQVDVLDWAKRFEEKFGESPLD